jgi:hypothetical protein
MDLGFEGTFAQERSEQLQSAEQKPLGKNGFVYKPKYGVIIICADEDEQKTIYERLLAEGFKLRVVVV